MSNRFTFRLLPIRPSRHKSKQTRLPLKIGKHDFAFIEKAHFLDGLMIIVGWCSSEKIGIMGQGQEQSFDVLQRSERPDVFQYFQENKISQNNLTHFGFVAACQVSKPLSRVFIETASGKMDCELPDLDDVNPELIDTLNDAGLSSFTKRTPGTLDPRKERHRDAWVIDDHFDKDFYLAGFPVENKPLDPVSHYLFEGSNEGRMPTPWFSNAHYLAVHSDVAKAGINPFVHFCLHGQAEGRKLQTLRRAPQVSLYDEHRRALEPAPDFEEFDPTIGIGQHPRAKVLAYYLPQFHPIEVNDKQWGKGFTEWRQLARGMPRFKGHVQPRIPRDLGFYSLAEGEILRQQIEMARDAGLFGFCFYHYWFDGQRVLETPMERLLADPTLDFPFCLMWTNENWTRTWDGSEQEVILSQNYSDEKYVLLVDDLARHMADNRYIRISDRPLFFVYRPGLIPNCKESIARLRELFSERYGLEPLIMMAQGFGDTDPRLHGLDGAIEFPPHKVAEGLPPINNHLDILDPNYSGHSFSYDEMVQNSCGEESADFPLIRTVVPSWDNEARRPGRGMTFHGSTPAKFGAWTDRMIEFAHANPVYGEELICVNAWNEWAEGAILEPDVHYGAAYLNALSRSIYNVRKIAHNKRVKVLIVGHDANNNGAQLLAFNIAKVLLTHFGVEVRFVLCADGPLLGTYRALAPVHLVSNESGDAISVLGELAAEGYSLAIVNTTVSGKLLPALKRLGFSVIALIHELPNLLRSYNLSEEACAIAKYADQVIFPARIVQEGFVAFAGPILHGSEILPQGLYNIPLLAAASNAQELRSELGLPHSMKIVLGIGYADLRKGIDRFVSAGLTLAAKHEDIAFVWVGAPSMETSNWFQSEIDASGLSDRVRILGHREDVTRFFSGANALYLSSREDPFPSIVLEAMACGLPIVGHAGCGGCDEMIEQYGFLIPQNDPGAATSAILRAVREPSETLTIARKAEIIENYDFGAYVFGLVERLDATIVSVSAVVPSYNYAKHISGRMASVFAQTYPLREIIVLDDASHDDSVEELDRIAQSTDRDFSLHVNETNTASPFRQWLKGAQLAKGEYIWIAEADDLATPDLVSRLVARMRAAGSVLGFCDSRQIDEADRPIGHSYKPYINEVELDAFDHAFDMDGPEFLTRYLSVKNVILNVSGVIFRRDALLAAFAAVGEELWDYSMAGDWRLYVEICGRGGRVSYLSEVMNVHRRHNTSVTHALKVEKHLAEIEQMHMIARERVELDASQQAAQDAVLRAAAQHLCVPEQRG